MQLEGLTGSPLIDSQRIFSQEIDVIPPIGRKPRQHIVGNLDALLTDGGWYGQCGVADIAGSARYLLFVA